MLSRPSPVTVPEHEQHWVDRAADLAATFAKTVANDDLSGEMPVAHLHALAESGLDAAFLPVQHGGESLSYATLGAIVATIAAAHPAVAAVWLMHVGAAHALVALAEPQAAAFFAGELRAGKRFSNALSEPAGGNLFLAPQQDADPADNGWRLTGFKAFVSGSEIADYFFLNTRADGVAAYFGVAVDETVSFPPIEMTMGMRATRSRNVRLEGTPLLRRFRCGTPPANYANLISTGFAFISIGIAESALDAL
jgi:alkylation response protein AidB-like acyl-CoA dehydrogenase